MANYNPKIKKILVPLSLDSQDSIAIKQALVFEKIYNCEIVLLNVLNKGLNLSMINWDERIEKTKNELKQFAVSFFKGEVPEYITFRVVAGNLVKEILNISNQENCDLIIINKRERTTGISGLFVRENADKLISRAKCPVMTITKEHSVDKVKTILIPVDITKKVAIKIAWAKFLAKKFNAKIHIVSILNLNIQPLKSLAYRKGLLIEKSMKEAGVEAEIELLKANDRPTSDVVLSYIDYLNPDFVLLMTHQESILFDDYIGKFATEVIHRSSSPIFSLVPRKDMLMSDFIESFSTKIEHSKTVE